MSQPTAKKEVETFFPASQQDWRDWLQQNHDQKQSVWLIYHKKSVSTAAIGWSEAVDEALCFGWIDSTRKNIDKDTFMQFFSRRKPGSTWSKVNKAKVERLIADGLMTTAGLQCIEAAKQNGSWTIADDVEELIIPPDLEQEFEKHPGSKDFFLSINRSTRKMILHWLASAKQQKTRQNRVTQTAENAATKQKPPQFR